MDHPVNVKSLFLFEFANFGFNEPDLKAVKGSQRSFSPN